MAIPLSDLGDTGSGVNLGFSLYGTSSVYFDLKIGGLPVGMGNSVTSYDFNPPPVTYGYTTPPTVDVTLVNYSDQIDSISISEDSGNFTISNMPSLPITTGSSAVFTVAPITGLLPGTYTATVTVIGTCATPSPHYATRSFTVSFTVDPATYQIIYKDFDGADLTLPLPLTYPTSYTQGTLVTLPTDVPINWMPGYDFLGFYDCPLDPNQTIPIAGTPYSQLDFSIGNQITEIPVGTTGDVTLYLRPTSAMFDYAINSQENFLFGAPGVFPNGSTATITVLDPSSAEYQAALAVLEAQFDPGQVKIVEYLVFDGSGNRIQPNTFFGSAIIGFKLPAGFDPNTTLVVYVVPGGTSIVLNSTLVVDPNDPSIRYFVAETNHFSLYALVDTNEPVKPPINPSTPQTGDNNALAWGIASVSLLLGFLCLMLWRKKRHQKELR